TRALLADWVSLGRFELAVHLVAAPEMARMNRQFLDHAGATDVLTFDYGAEPAAAWRGFAPSATKQAGGNQSAAKGSSAMSTKGRQSPSPPGARTGGGEASELVRHPSAARPSGPLMEGQGGVGSSRHSMSFSTDQLGRRNAHFALRGEIFICIE